MKRLFALILVLVLSLSLVSCGGNGGNGGEEVKKYKIGVIYTANSAFWTSVGDGAAAKAEELNATGKYQITTYATGPAESGTSAQVQLFEDFVSQGYDGIIVAVSDPATTTRPSFCSPSATRSASLRQREDWMRPKRWSNCSMSWTGRDWSPAVSTS